MGVKDSNEVLLNYEIDYIKNHQTIASPDKFEISEAEFQDFKARVLKANFKYDGQSAKALDEVEKVAKFEGYYDDAKVEFEALKKKLDHNVAKDLEYNKKYIKQLLANDILSAYYFQAGALQNQLGNDKTMQAAVKLLKDKKEYDKILSAKK